MLQKNYTKERLREGKVQIGVLQSLPVPAITEVIGLSGFDFVMADAEHGSLSFMDMELIARAAELTGMTPLVRVPGILSQDVVRFLDAGAAGVIVPNIHNKHEVDEVIDKVKYPPLGTHGVALPRSGGYGQMNLKEWTAYANEQTLVVIEIETKEAIENLDEIISSTKSDVIFMGPLDISAALGVLGEIDHPLVMDARRKILDACKKYNVTPGTFAFTPEQLAKLTKEGFRFFLLGVDFLYLKEGCKAALDTSRKLIEGNQ